MRKLLLTPLFLIAVAAFILFWWYQNIQPASSDNKAKSFLITKGTSASLIGENLFKQGFIKSPLAFKFYVQLTGKQNKIQAGEYELAGNVSLFNIVTELLKGPSELWVTVPEGLRREQVGEKFLDTLGKDSAFMEEFLSLTEGEEGFLFPDTYLFAKEASASAIVNKMKSTFDKKITTEDSVAINGLGYSLSQVVTMASILERETLNDAEKPVVAGILFKRLEAGWPLQADATLQYAIANVKCQMSNVKCKDWWVPPTGGDKQINSPYNTYRFVGLPPGPIASPGEKSLKASIYPEESEYWYYLHDPKGEIHYGRTLEEHNANIQKYLR